MQVAAQAMSQAVASAAQARRLRMLPIYLIVAAGIAGIALLMLVSPTLAQETAAAAETATSEPLNLAPIGAGLAALAIIGPGIGIGILAGMSAGAIGRNPDASGEIRGVAVLMAAFAEGLGIIALVVALALVFV
jgi:F-type H+-transporting ATPase subunit c